MNKVKEWSATLANDKIFDIFITAVILVNSFLIGVQTTVYNHTVEMI